MYSVTVYGKIDTQVEHRIDNYYDNKFTAACSAAPFGLVTRLVSYEDFA
jgi:hypothetical protein